NGLNITATGTIVTNNVTADTNGNAGSGFGAYFTNLSSTSAGITVSGNNFFNNNHAYGLVVYSKGMITLNNITADGSQNFGGLYADNSSGRAQKGIILKGTNEMSWNSNDVLQVSSAGTITLKNVTANNNQYFGGAVYNDNPGATGTIVLSGNN